MIRRTQLLIFPLLAHCARASAGLATFDSLPEGFILQEQLVDGGITFYDADSRIGQSRGGTFAIEDVSTAFLGFPGFDAFSSPNVLTLSFLGPGADNWAASRFGEVWFTTGQIENHVSVDVFHLDDSNVIGNQIVLAIYKDAILVGTDAVTLTDCCHQYDELSISNIPFDSAVLRGVGPHENGVFFGAIDNVLVIPEPTTMLLLIVGLVALRNPF